VDGEKAINKAAKSVRKHLAAINNRPVMNELYEKLDDIPSLIQQAQASTRP
jgi:cell fate (sporulation/competence/biofilm development) regulator YmcA (YheA/YmcA/DUF963 family)